MPALGGIDSASTSNLLTQLALVECESPAERIPLVVASRTTVGAEKPSAAAARLPTHAPCAARGAHT